LQEVNEKLPQMG